MKEYLKFMSMALVAGFFLAACDEETDSIVEDTVTHDEEVSVIEDTTDDESEDEYDD